LTKALAAWAKRHLEEGGAHMADANDMLQRGEAATGRTEIAA
jgi:hypothetical protein